MDGITGVSGVVADRPPLTGAPGDGVMLGDIRLHLIVSRLWDDRVPFSIVSGMGWVIGVQGEVGGVTLIIIKWIPISLRAGGICRVKLWVFNNHFDGLSCRRLGGRHEAGDE